MTAYPKYTAEALPRGPFDEVSQIAAAAYDPGDIVLLADGRAGVVAGNEAVAIGDPVTFKTAGVFEVAAASGTTFANGAQVNWDDSGKAAVAKSSGTFYLGAAVKAKTSGSTSVLVNINAPSLPTS